MLPIFATGIDFVVFCLALFFLVKATGILLESLDDVALRSHLNIFILMGFFSALGTNLPELFVSIMSASAGKQNLILGVVFGSNVVNLSLIIGAAAFFGGSLSVVADFVSQQILKAFLASIAPILLLIDGTLSRLDGALLIMVFVAYHITTYFANQHRKPVSLIKVKYRGKKKIQLNLGYLTKDTFLIVTGLAMLLFSADVLVKAGSRIATDLQIPILLVGMIFVAVGTSLPELALQLKASHDRQPQVVFGNLLGSIVANATLVLGMASLINPIIIRAHTVYAGATIAYVACFTLFWLFIRTKYRLERWEGLVLVLVYIAFLAMEIITAVD